MVCMEKVISMAVCVWLYGDYEEQGAVTTVCLVNRVYGVSL